MQLPFQRWLEGEGAVEEVKRMAEVFKLEQFVKCLPPELHRWLVDKKPLTLSAAAKLADEYAVLYKQVPMEATGGPKQDSFGWRRNSPQMVNSGFRKFAPARDNSDTQSCGGQIVCNYCKQVGHVISRCGKLRQKRERSFNENWRSGAQHVGLVNKLSAPVDVHGFGSDITVDKRYMPFCVNGGVFDENEAKRSVVFLRDSGSLQSLVSKECVRLNEFKDTGETRLLKGISGAVMELPLVQMRVECEFAKGEILCCLINELPAGISILIGNDIAMEGEPMNIAVVTRAQSRLNADERTERVNEQVLTQADVCNDACTDELSEGDLEQLFSDSDDFMRVPNECVSHKELVKLQRADVELKPLFVLAEANGHVGAGRSGYEIVNGVLVRRWSDKITPQGIGLTQIVAPSQIRKKLLNVAHDSLASGHLGTQKTLDRLLRHFWWPCVNKSVGEYCRSCEVCQMSNEGEPVVNVPIIDAVDVVGTIKRMRESVHECCISCGS